MGEVIYTAYALAHALLLVLAIRHARRRPNWTIAVVIVLAATLAYDNLMLVVGSVVGEGDLLLGLSRPRFIIHALVTPISIAVIVAEARRLGVRWAAGPRAGQLTWALVVLLVGLGVADLARLELVIDNGLGLLRYTSAEASVPIPAVVSVVVMIAAGWSLRRASGWSVLFWLGVVSFVGSAAPPIDGLLVIGNLVEIAFVAALYASHLQFPPGSGPAEPSVADPDAAAEVPSGPVANASS